MKEEKIKYEETQYGFIYGDADVSRMASNVHTPGDVVICVNTSKYKGYGIQIRVTKTGKVSITGY